MCHDLVEDLESMVVCLATPRPELSYDQKWCTDIIEQVTYPAGI
jgi:hypothetical protein